MRAPVTSLHVVLSDVIVFAPPATPDTAGRRRDVRNDGVYDVLFFPPDRYERT